MNKTVANSKKSKFRKQGILFDFDGVLINSEKYYSEIWVKILYKYKISFSDDQLIGKNNIQFLNQFNLNEKQKKEILIKKNMMEKDFFIKKKIDPLVYKMIDKVHRNFVLGIVSNNYIENIKSFLSGNEISNNFKLIIGQESNYTPKPSPESYLAAVNLLNLEKKDVIIVEDSQIGFSAAENAQIDYIKFDYNDLINSINNIMLTIKIAS